MNDWWWLADKLASRDIKWPIFSWWVVIMSIATCHISSKQGSWLTLYKITTDSFWIVYHTLTTLVLQVYLGFIILSFIKIPKITILLVYLSAVFKSFFKSIIFCKNFNVMFSEKNMVSPSFGSVTWSSSKKVFQIVKWS